MKRSTKLIALATAALIGTASLTAYAHQSMRGYNQGAYPNQGPMVVKFEKQAQQLAAVEKNLNLTAEQQPLWDSFIGKVKEAREDRAEFRDSIDRDVMRAMSNAERMEFRQSMMAEYAEDRAEIDAARKALFDALTPEQQQKAAFLAATPGNGCDGRAKAGSAHGYGKQGGPGQRWAN